MDPIHPIVPNESRIPILPARGAEAVRREQRRDAHEQEHSGSQRDDDPAEEQYEDADDEQVWDRPDRRAGDLHDAADERPRPFGGDDEPPRPHIDISV